MVGARIGAQKLGYNITAVPPGKRAFPLHNHHANTEELRYLAVSTMITPETVEYPDSGKIAMLSRQTAPDGRPRMVRHVARAADSVGYWDGE